ncbi:Leucine aminopeptidase 2 [Venturia nashicola]|nr:Leucine aminopeptidase 2 [Venturia nashicola]
MPAMDFSDRRLQRTPDWEPVEKGIINTDSLVPSFDTGFGSPLHQREASAFQASSSEIKSKLKTRGTSLTEHTLFSQAHTEAMEERVSPKQHLFRLKERDWRVFHSLFYQPSSENAVGKIKFHDLLHAMSSVGFSYQKMGGSAWLFVPPIECKSRGISFHEPHGVDTKISFWMARQIGRRLQRVCGWGRNNFAAG